MIMAFSTPRLVTHRLSLLQLLACIALWFGLVAAQATEFLEPERAFQVQVEPTGERALRVRIDVEKGYYLYREAFKFEAVGATLGGPEVPPGQVKFDQTFQKNVETLRGQVTVQLPVEQAGAEFKLSITTQGCADAGLCYPPMTTEAHASLAGFGGTGKARVLPAAAALGAGPATGGLLATAPGPTDSQGGGDDSRIGKLLAGGSLVQIVGGFLLLGVMLSLTPCVLPMVPILSSIIVGGQSSPRRGQGLLLAATYSLGMALVYTALGVAAGLLGEGLAAALQNRWVLLSFGLVMAVLSLSMFDVFELRLPAAIEQRLANASQGQSGGRLAGVFAMGGLSALIVSPCVSAPLAGALLFISQTGDVWLGGTALFALSAGMSVPLLLVGASAGKLLPKAGPWMVGVKRLFGVLLLAVAVYIAQPALPAWLALSLWGLLAAFCGLLLWWAGTSHTSRWAWRSLALVMVAVGVGQWLGAATGATDPTRPLAKLWPGPAATAQVLTFEPVSSLPDLEARLARAGRPVVLDFYADWCVSCKEMERFTFSDPDIARRMSGALLLKADVTANNAEHRALLKRFKLFGPPGIVFFDANGKELTAVRVIGYQPALRFAASLTEAGL